MRCLSRLLVVGSLVAGGAYLLGYRWDDVTERVRAAGAGAGAEAEAFTDNLDRQRVRAAGHALADRIDHGAERAGEALAAGRLTAKIKAKMALDDTLDGSDIDVHTAGTVVTLGGSVDSDAQRRRALQLARETEGVTSVADRLDVRRQTRF